MKGVESYRAAWQKWFKEDEDRLKCRGKQAKKAVREMSKVPC